MDATFTINKLFVYLSRCMPTLDQLAQLAEIFTKQRKEIPEDELINSDVKRFSAMLGHPRKQFLAPGEDGFLKGGDILNVLAERMSRVAGYFSH